MKIDMAYAFEQPPAPGQMMEVAPGIHWVRMALPFALDHINLWLLEDGDGWTLVDTGMSTDATRELWRAVLSGPAGGRPLKRVVATHFHPDHGGLSGWFEREYGTVLWMTRAEWLTGHWMSSFEGLGEQVAAFFARHGLPSETAQTLAALGNVYRRRVTPYPASYRRIRHGDAIEIGGRAWQVVVGEGHSPEQACLFCPDLSVLIAGDQVLPSITPNVSVMSFDPYSNPLADFLASVHRFRRLPEETLVLPSHGRPFRALHQRLTQIERHHAARLSEIAHACDGTAKTAFELLPVLFNRILDQHQLVFAMGEAISHLVYLERDGDLVAERGEVWRYRR